MQRSDLLEPFRVDNAGFDDQDIAKKVADRLTILGTIDVIMGAVNRQGIQASPKQDESIAAQAPPCRISAPCHSYGLPLAQRTPTPSPRLELSFPSAHWGSLPWMLSDPCHLSSTDGAPPGIL